MTAERRGGSQHNRRDDDDDGKEVFRLDIRRLLRTRRLSKLTQKIQNCFRFPDILRRLFFVHGLFFPCRRLQHARPTAGNELFPPPQSLSPLRPHVIIMQPSSETRVSHQMSPYSLALPRPGRGATFLPTSEHRRQGPRTRKAGLSRLKAMPGSDSAAAQESQR